MMAAIAPLLSRLDSHMARKGERLLLRTDLALDRIALGWAGLLFVMMIARLAQTALSVGASGHWLASLPVYVLIALAPLIGLRLARSAFPADILYAIPDIDLRPGRRWHRLDPLAARDHPCFGTGGLIAGLAIGLLLNVAIRTAEFLAAVPAMAAVSDGWAHRLYLLLAADCIFFNMLYPITFVMAVRKNPWFPTMMAITWMLDIAAQLAIARALGDAHLPPAVASAMVGFLGVNVQKTLISIALWLPYLMLSDRVNVTYRGRIRK